MPNHGENATSDLAIGVVHGPQLPVKLAYGEVARPGQGYPTSGQLANRTGLHPQPGGDQPGQREGRQIGGGDGRALDQSK